MKWEHDYLFGGLGLLIAVLFLYLTFPSFDPLLLICISILLIIAGLFERMEYYNKKVFLVLVVAVLLATLSGSFILTPPPTNPQARSLYHIGTGIFIVFIGCLAYLFICKFDKSKGTIKKNMNKMFSGQYICK